MRSSASDSPLAKRKSRATKSPSRRWAPAARRAARERTATTSRRTLGDPLRLHHPFGDPAAHHAHVIDLGVGAGGHHALDLVVLEVDPGVVVAGVPRLHFPGSDQLLVQGSPPRLAVVVRRVTALDEAEALDDRQLLGARIGRALLEPAERPGARATEHDPAIPRLAQHDVDALGLPDRLL